MFDKAWIENAMELQKKIQEHYKGQNVCSGLDKELIKEAFKISQGFNSNHNWYKDIMEKIMPSIFGSEAKTAEAAADPLAALANLIPFREPAADAAANQPNFNITETEDTITLIALLPGIKSKDDISVQLTGNTIYFSGKTKPAGQKDGNLLKRAIKLPGEVIPDGATAVYREQYLIIKLPKLKTAYTIAVEF